MRIIYFVFFLFLSTAICKAQNYQKVDSIVAKYPNNFQKIEALTDRISQDFSDPFEQIRALYDWITTHITYDKNESGFRKSISYSTKDEYNRKLKEQNLALARRVFSKKKGVCEGYTVLFQEGCNQLGFQSVYVSGYAKTSLNDIYHSYQSNHAWNIVGIDGEDYLIDTTWGVKDDTGNIDYSYFLTPPELLIKNHYPDDYKHSLLSKKVSKKEYLKAPVFFLEGLSKYAIISPAKNGVLRLGKLIPFEIEFNKDPIWVSYQFGSNSYMVEDYQISGNRLSFEVPLEGRGRSLTIFINNDAVAKYKVRN